MQPSVKRILKRYQPRPANLVEVLTDLQNELGYLGEPALRQTASYLNVPLIEVFRVANFYTAFSLSPRGRHVLVVCAGTACHVRSSAAVLQEACRMLDVQPGQTTADGAFTVEPVNCLGACALGPVVVLDGKVHPRMSPARLRKLVQAARKLDKEAVHA